MEKKQSIDCPYCGLKKTLTVTIKNTTQSTSLKVGKCIACKKQSGVKDVFKQVKYEKN
jgi:transcription elongation factor Elf1